MKKLVFLTIFSLLARPMLAQVQPAFVDIDKVKRQGYAASTDIDRRTLERAWKDKLGQYGRVDAKRDVYTVNFAKTPFLDNQATMVSQLNTSKGRTQIFLSVDAGNGEYVAAGHGQGAQVEKILLDFMRQIDYDEQMRGAGKTFQEAETNQKDLTRKGERLIKELENNKKEAERLTKKLEENKLEFTKLQADTAQNRIDRTAAQQVLEKQRQSLENVKTRKPNER